MNLALAQMQIGASMEENLTKTLRLMEQAKESGAELIFFPEIQLSPFFPQHEKRDAFPWLLRIDAPEITAIREQCEKLKLFASPNVYLELDGKRYDASLMIDDHGDIFGISKMVHIAQATQFYEQDYYAPSDDGFKVYDTPFGKIGVVICFDRHYPESIRTESLMGADLILIPTANVKSEPSELFEWELRVQAYQSSVAVAMCNRVGTEGTMVFSGESLVIAPDGGRIVKAEDQEELICAEIDLSETKRVRESKPYTNLRRTEFYL